MRMRVGAVLTVVTARLIYVAGASSAESDPSALKVAPDSGVPHELRPGPVIVASSPGRLRLSSTRMPESWAPRRLQAGNAAADGRRPRTRRRRTACWQAIDAQDIAATPLYDVQTAYNGIAVQAEAGAADELGCTAGRQGGARDSARVGLDNHSSVPLIGGVQAWNSFGKTGRRPEDRRHRLEASTTSTRGFRGSGLRGRLPSSRRASTANPPRPGLEPRPASSIPRHLSEREGRRRLRLRRRRLQGVNAATARPEPEDCNGHGSHVAGTAAGTA